MKIDESNTERGRINFRKYLKNENVFNSKMFSKEYSHRESRTNVKKVENEEKERENLGQIKNISEILKENHGNALQINNYALNVDILKNKINRLAFLATKEKEIVNSENDELKIYTLNNTPLRNSTINLKIVSLANNHITQNKITSEKKTKIEISKNNKKEYSIQRENEISITSNKLNESLDELVNDILSLKTEFCSSNNLHFISNSPKLYSKNLTDTKAKSKSHIENFLSPSSLFKKYKNIASYITNKKDESHSKLIKEYNKISLTKLHYENEVNLSDFSFSRENFFSNQTKKDSSNKKLYVHSGKKYKSDDIINIEQNDIKKSLIFSEFDDENNLSAEKIDNKIFIPPFKTTLSSINIKNEENNSEKKNENFELKEFNLNLSNRSFSVSTSTNTSRKKVTFIDNSQVFNYNNKRAVEVRKKLKSKSPVTKIKSILKDKSLTSFSEIESATDTSTLIVPDSARVRTLALDKLNKLIQECELEDNCESKINATPKRSLTPDVVNTKKSNFTTRDPKNQKLPHKTSYEGHYCRKFLKNPKQFYTSVPPEAYFRSLSLTATSKN